jgi:hypothetical protein
VRPLLMKCITQMCGLSRICVCILLFCDTGLAQQSPSGLAQQSASPTKAPTGGQVFQDSSPFLEYAKFVREEEHAHREYLETLYTRTSVVLGVLIGLGVALIGFLQFKTKRDVRKAVNAVFHETVGEEVQSRMEQFRKDLIEVGKGQRFLTEDVRGVTALLGMLSR